jgi:hypothetical protein
VNFRRFSSRGMSICEFEYGSCKGGFGLGVWVRDGLFLMKV